MRPQWGMLALVVLTQISVALLSQGLPTVFAFLQEDFRLSRAELGLILSAMEVGAVASLAVGGWAADAFGIRRLLSLALLLFAVVSVAFSQASTYHVGLMVLPFAGVALGIAIPALAIAVVLWFPASSRATAMGVMQTGVPLAGVLCAAVLPSIALTYGWRTGILLIGASNVMVALLMYITYRDPPNSRALGVAARPSPAQIRALLGQRDLLLTNVFAAVLSACQLVIFGYLILYLRDHQSVPLVVGGLILALAQVGAVLGRILWGLLSDLILHGRRAPALGLAGGTAAVLLVALAVMPPGVPLWLLTAVCMLLGFSAFGWQGLRHALVAELSPRGATGTALGISQTLGKVGPICGPPLFGTLADRAGYHAAWLVAAALAAAVSVLIVGLLRERPATSPAGAAGVGQKPDCAVQADARSGSTPAD